MVQSHKLLLGIGAAFLRSVACSPPSPTITTCPALPETLPPYSNKFLPDPFTFFGGQQVTTYADWDCRRQEISDLLQRTQYGQLPPQPSEVTGSLDGKLLTVKVIDNNKTITFTATIELPTGKGPFPALIALERSSLPELADVATITYSPDELATATHPPYGKFFEIYGRNHNAGPIMIWVWAASRIIDALEALPEVPIDLKKLAVTGCSRFGQAAMAIGAFEKRIALTLPQESGYGGAACWRIPIPPRSVPTLPSPENYFFSRVFDRFIANPSTQPVDHHLLAGLIAPRGLFVIDNSGMEWLGPTSSWGCMSVAKEVWKALGADDNMGFSSVGKHNHCQFPSAQAGGLEAFVDRFLRGKGANTTIFRSDVAFNFRESEYVDWLTPTLA